MTYYVRLDVSLEQTAVCVIDDVGHVVVERTVASHPDEIDRCVVGLTGTIGRIGLKAIGIARRIGAAPQVDRWNRILDGKAEKP